MPETEKFAALCQVIDTLLDEGGCAWDQAQTNQSLRPHFLEECYEALDALDHEDWPALCEELGDVLHQVVFQGRLAQRAGYFRLEDVFEGIREKLVRRHSHVFGQDAAETVADVEQTWEANKRKEKPLSAAENVRAVPKALPALVRAQKVLKRAEGAQADETSLAQGFAQARNLLDRLEIGASCDLEDVGKLLLFVARISTKMQINAEFALTNGIEAFINNFER